MLEQIKAALYRLNWKTTAAAVGAVLVELVNRMLADPSFAPYAIKLQLAALVLGMFFARDANKSDQQLKLRPPVPGVDPVRPSNEVDLRA